MKFAPLAAIACLLFALAGCGGSGAPAVDAPPAPLPADPAPPVTPPPPVTPDPPPTPLPPVPSDPEPPAPPESPFNAILKAWNRCAVPRTGLDPFQQAYPDVQGTLGDELTFLRLWLSQSYLWYRELPALDPAGFSDPVAYFDAMKTPALLASGQPKDKFHFTYDSARWDALQTRGSALGYGLTWSRAGATVPRLWLATVVEPGSPARAAGMQRGDQLLTVDGVDFEHASDAASVAAINAALFPVAKGERHVFTLRRGAAIASADMVSSEVAASPVKYVKVIDTAKGKVGYINFASHNAVSERLLFDAVTELKAAAIDDLVLDVRYNGGGLLYVASTLSYMIAGFDATRGKAFEHPVHNDKTAQQPDFPFYTKTYGFAAPQPARAGLALPTLNLKRVTLLTTPGTCSASEAIINSLRGVDVEVNLVGGQTCGKPYAFSPTSNCGTTYFAIEFQGVNAKGFGDFQDGFAPTCRVSDDLAREQGDPAEGMLAAALTLQQTGACPAPRSGVRASAVPLQLVRAPAEEIAISHRAR